MSTSVSHFSATDLDISNTKKNKKKIRNGCRHLFLIFLKWISTSISHKKKRKKNQNGS